MGDCTWNLSDVPQPLLSPHRVFYFFFIIIYMILKDFLFLRIWGLGEAPGGVIQVPSKIVKVDNHVALW